MYIETQRMIIREYTMGDSEDLYEIFGNAEVMKPCEPAYSPEKTTDFLSTFCIGKRGSVAAVHKDSGKMIGYILFKAFESCKAVVEYAFNQLEAHKIFAEAIDSVKSVGLMKKLGMRLEGIQRSQTKDNDGNWADLYFYGLLKEEQ